MIKFNKLVIASGNLGKLREMNALLESSGIRVLPQSDFNVPEIDEPHSTFIENALTKARHACRHTGLPAVADDSGICVNAIKGAPGILSARFAGEPKSDQRNNKKLIEILKNETDRSAYYYCTIVLLRHADDPQPIIAEGLWQGEITPEPRGKDGFGYDPHFYLPELQKTAAELETAEKNKISHRSKALNQLIKYLKF